MKIKPYKGRVLWGCYADIEDGVLRWYEWIITSVQNRNIKSKMLGTGYSYVSRKAYARVKIKGVTWVKRTRKHRDWGWAKNIDRTFRKTFFVDEDGMIDLKFKSIYTTKRAALFAERKYLKGSIVDIKESIKDPKEERWIDEWKSDLVEEEAQLRMVARRISRKLW